MARFHGSRFSRYLVVSVLLHFLVVALALFGVFTPPETMAKVTDKQFISLGLQAAMAGAFQSPAVAQVQPEPEPVKEPEKEVVEEIAPEPVVEKKRPVKEDVVVKEPQKKMQEPEVEPPELKKTEEQPEEKEPEKKEPEDQKKPMVAMPAMKAGNQGISGAQEQNREMAETGLGHQAGGASEEQFDRLIREHLLAKKVTPKLLRHKRRQGEVTVEFVINRLGEVTSKRLVKPSRVREFDRAAIKLIDRAAPFPVAPDYVSWQTRHYEIVVNYSVR